MRKLTYFTALIITVFLFTSCEKLLEPQRDNRLTGEQVKGDPAYAEGILLNAYQALPTSYNFTEVATDDAVTNVRGNNLLRMATGEWKSTFNPMSTWDDSYKQIYYLNMFLEMYRDVEWSWESKIINQNYLKRLKGEAYGLRAWYEFQLLQAHGGISETGELLGFPIVTSTLTADDDLELPRNSYEDCVKQILDDCDSALYNLPYTYKDSGVSFYDAVFGSSYRGRFNGQIASALKSRITLYVSSPAFTSGLSPAEIQMKWEEAAVSAGELLEKEGGVSGLSATGLTFYLKDTDTEIIWRNTYVTNRTLETQNYPPTLFGQGRTNPSQNLVDAFPMANGYPINHGSSGYDASDPYTNRDPRLKEYIVYNGNTLRKFFAVNTSVDGTKDGINASTESTRTGYYLRKFMHPDVNCDPSFSNNARHFYTYFRFTEIFLNYAEAVNELAGPDGDPFGFGFTPRDVIGAIRDRAGISQPDQYLSEIASTEDMRSLIHNERRLEMSFEGFRFWDIRRWKAPINEAARGVYISNNNTSYDYQVIENRDYLPYMIYGPIPYNETLLYDIKQNMDW